MRPKREIASLKSELEAATALMNEVTSAADARVNAARDEFEKDALRCRRKSPPFRPRSQAANRNRNPADRARISGGQLQTTAEKLDSANRDNTEQAGTIRQLQSGLHSQKPRSLPRLRHR